METRLLAWRVGCALCAVTSAGAQSLATSEAPRAAVDRARVVAPVLDPIEGNFRLGTAPLAGGPRRASVAYDSSSDQYYTAWVDPLFQALQGRLVLSDGTPSTFVGAVPGAGPFSYAFDPQVAAVDAPTNRFAVVCVGGIVSGPYTLIAGISANGNGSSIAAVNGLGGVHEDPDVGGGPGGSDVIVVYRNVSAGKLQMAEFDMATMTTLGVVDLTTSANAREPAISSSGGSVGRYLAVWEVRTGGPNQTDVWGAVVDRDATLLAGPFTIADGSLHQRDPDVDGDGTNWWVAYERQEGAGSLDHDIICRRVTYHPSSGQVSVSSPAVVDAEAGVDEIDPAVTWMGESVLVAYLNQFSGAGTDYDVWVESMDTASCAPCEGASKITVSNNRELALGIGSQRSGGGPGSEALLVWMSQGLEGHIVQAQRYGAEDGVAASLGGRCGAGGVALASCGSVNGSSFGLELQNAAPNASALLVLGTEPGGFACGPCALKVRPVLNIPRITDSQGGALESFDIGEPAFVGLQLYSQWVVIAPGGCSAIPGVSFSSALATTWQ